jgi:hypothetical protein
MLAPFVFTSCLMPLLLSTASQSPPHRVRVVNVSSDMAYRMSGDTMQLEDVNMTDTKGPMELL